MKAIAKIAVVILALFATSCSEDKGVGDNYLDVTHNNISGVWSLQSYDNGVELAEGSYYYIEFERAERTFVSYDNLDSMGARVRSGRYDIAVDGAAVIRGIYNYGLGDWEHRYYVRNMTADTMEWVATDDESIVQVYVRAELPEWLPKEENND